MKKSIIILFALVSIISCRKDEINKFDGPDLNDVYGEFKIIDSLKSSVSSVDFSQGTMHFSCELSKLSQWKLEIEGQNSGAVKIIEGSSRVLDASTALWDGSTTIFPLFQAEMCDVMLTFEGEVDTLHTTLELTGLKPLEGFIVANFEDGWKPGWTKFVQSGANMKFDIQNDSVTPEATSYYNMQGEVNWDWLIGLVDFNAAAYNETTLPLSANGDNLFFNCLVYGEPQLDNSRILFRFDEDENEDGEFDETTEDQFGYEVIIDWAGWRLISVKYSDIVGNGNGGDIHNPDKLNKVSILHLANPASGFAKTAVDLMIFTENEALQP